MLWALTEQVLPGHVGLFLGLHWLENKHPVQVQVLEQLFTVKGDPTAPLHQVPVGRARRPVYLEEPPFGKENCLSLLDDRKLTSSHSAQVSAHFPCSGIALFFLFFLSFF